MSTTPVIDWHRCYADSWKGFVTDESFTHPAKFAPGLAKHMYAYGLGCGYWSMGDLIGDPFGGIGGGGIWAAFCGLRWLGVELEPRFVECERSNFELHRVTWKHLGYEMPRIVQGDSRRFAEIVGAGMAGCVTSPPYANSLDAGGPDTPAPDGRTRAMQGRKDRYGTTPGQIGKLKEGKLDGVVTSPPYAGSNQDYAAGWQSIDKSKGTHDRPSRQMHAEYGSAPGQIGKLKEGKLDGVVTSPPFEMCLSNRPSAQILAGSGGRMGSSCKSDDYYGNESGQIGAVAGDTYWSAMALVYAQVLAALKPGGVMACVVKDYVQDRQRVPLCDHTLALLIETGFEPIERARAWLTRTTREAGLLGDIVTTKSRKSFFRRLAEKNGSPAIDFEEVLWVRRPA